MGDQAQVQSQVRYIHLKEISVDFIKTRPKSILELVFTDDARLKHKSPRFKEGDHVHWNLDNYVRTHTSATLKIQRALFKISLAQVEFKFKPNVFRDYSSIVLEGGSLCFRVEGSSR